MSNEEIVPSFSPLRQQWSGHFLENLTSRLIFVAPFPFVINIGFIIYISILLLLLFRLQDIARSCSCRFNWQQKCCINVYRSDTVPQFQSWWKVLVFNLISDSGSLLVEIKKSPKSQTCWNSLYYRWSCSPLTEDGNQIPFLWVKHLKNIFITSLKHLCIFSLRSSSSWKRKGREKWRFTFGSLKLIKLIN